MLNSKLALFWPVRTPGTRASLCTSEDCDALCDPHVDLTSLLAVPVLNKGRPWGGRQRADRFDTLGLVLHACSLKLARAPSVSGSLCHSLSLFVTHTHIPSPSLLYTCFFTHTETHPCSL